MRRRLLSVKYWGYLGAKLLAVTAVLALGWIGLNAVWPNPQPFMKTDDTPLARGLEYNLAVMIFGLIGVGLYYLVILDQRFRCRNCLRRLRMPITIGEWGHLLLSTPQTQYICPYGHGTLTIADARFGSDGQPDWHAIDDMWKELEALDRADK